jgi:hypothetical protein
LPSRLADRVKDRQVRDLQVRDLHSSVAVPPQRPPNFFATKRWSQCSGSPPSKQKPFVRKVDEVKVKQVKVEPR